MEGKKHISLCHKQKLVVHVRMERKACDLSTSAFTCMQAPARELNRGPCHRPETYKIQAKRLFFFLG